MIIDELTYEQCVAQGVGPMVFPARLEQGIDPANKVGMKTVCLHNMQEQVKLSHTLSVAWSALEQAGIQAVLMKGAGLAAFYPEPQMRQWGDIDLYVGEQQYHPACAAMRAAFPEALKFDEELDHYKHYNLIADGVSIEIHRVTVALSHPLDARRYARMEEYAALHACDLKIEDLRLKIFEPTFNALFVMLHSWEHMLSAGANMRQLCDLTFLLHHYAGRLDARRLKHYLRALHLTDVWQLYMWIAVHHLGQAQDEALFYTDSVAVRAERLMNDLLAGKMRSETAHAVGGETATAARNRFARKWHTMRERMANARRMATYSPSYARHMAVTVWLSGLGRLFAKDRHWE